MRDVFASDVMSAPLIAVNTDASVFNVSKIMVSKNIGSVLVSDGASYIGIITKMDLVKAIASGKDTKSISADSVMSTPIRSVDVSTPIMKVAKLMASYGVRRIIVKDNLGMVGLVSDKDITKIAPELIELVQENAKMGVK
ncbi:MAG: CBS domain-containing protein [Candidatus Altiarchaeota archaeon]|nr:CBS domain-containing protein [Candidatus Altiarchaeota archaeon]